ncbi:hypothetical protein TNCV_2369551 [Trichonephila clavipes]|nr:hypothetical protein TNCV_2369551 [Trichonephila clavipes]
MSPRPLPLHSFCRATSPDSLYYGQTKPAAGSVLGMVPETKEWFRKPKSVSERHDSLFLDQLPVLPLSNECCFLLSTVNVRMSPRPLPLHSSCRATSLPCLALLRTD